MVHVVHGPHFESQALGQLLNHSTIGILGWKILCGAGLSCKHCGMFGNVPGLYSLDAAHCDN
jgi:hypothetical protein